MNAKQYAELIAAIYHQTVALNTQATPASRHDAMMQLELIAEQARASSKITAADIELHQTFTAGVYGDRIVLMLRNAVKEGAIWPTVVRHRGVYWLFDRDADTLPGLPPNTPARAVYFCSKNYTPSEPASSYLEVPYDGNDDRIW